MTIFEKVNAKLLGTISGTSYAGFSEGIFTDFVGQVLDMDFFVALTKSLLIGLITWFVLDRVKKYSVDKNTKKEVQ